MGIFYFHALIRNYKFVFVVSRPYQYLLICTKLPKELMREYIIELLKFKDEEQLIKQFQSWTLPTIPINGHDVKSAGVKSKKYK